MFPVTRRSLVRGAALVAPASLLLDPGPTDALEPLATPLGTPLLRGGGCAPRDKVAKLLRHDMTGKHQGRMHGVPSNYNLSLIHI